MSWRRYWKIVAVVIVGGALFAAWAHGTFDRPLSSIGLNSHECARNGLGETFCGQELNEYRERYRKLDEQLGKL